MCKKLDLSPFKKGQVWMMTGATWTKEQRDSGIICGDRPVIIYSDISINRNFVHAIACTTNTEYSNGVELNLEVGVTSCAPPQNLIVVPINNLTMFLGTIDDEKMAEIDDAFLVYFGLKHDIDIKSSVFTQTKDQRPTFFDKACPAPTRPKLIIIDPDNIPKEDETKTTINNEVKTKPVTIPTANKNAEPKVVNKKRPAINVASLSEDEKNFIITGKVKDITERMNICTSTVYRLRKALTVNTNNPPAKPKKEEKKPEAPKIVSTSNYRNKTYKKFANKKLAKLTFDEKRLFTQLDSCKLSTTMNVPLNAIVTAQQSFREELGL